MDKPPASPDSIMNGIINKARKQAVADDRARGPMFDIKISHWSGHVYLAPTEVPPTTRDQPPNGPP